MSVTGPSKGEGRVHQCGSRPPDVLRDIQSHAYEYMIEACVLLGRLPPIHILSGPSLLLKGMYVFLYLFSRMV